MTKQTFIFIYMLALLTAGSSGASSICAQVVSPTSKQTISIESIEDLTAMSYNVENLFYYVGKYERLSQRQFRRLPGNPPMPKPEYKFKQIESIIWQERPMLIGLQEVDGEAGIEKLMDSPAGQLYYFFFIKGNDGRNLQVATMVRKDLPFRYEYYTNKDKQWRDPTTGTLENLFARDLTELRIFIKGHSRPLLSFLNSHFKSKRPRPGDFESIIWRSAHFDGAAQVVDELKQEFGEKYPILAVGDFNTDLQDSLEPSPLRQRMVEGFEVAKHRTPNEGKPITHTYHPRTGPTHYSQMDGMFISRHAAEAVSSARVVEYYDSAGRLRPLPKTFDERNSQGSDHRATIYGVHLRTLMELSRSIDQGY